MSPRHPVVRIFSRFVAVLAAGAAFAYPVAIPPELEAAAKANITRATLAAPIRFLGSDALEGRGPATRGDVLARTYLVSELMQLGLKAGGPNGNWQQPFDIVGITTEVPKVWTFTAKNKNVDLKYHEDFIAASGVQKDSAAIDSAELVFVGYGIQAPEFKWDDFKGANLKGKVLVMLNNDPDWDPKLFAGNRRLYYGRWTYKYESGARQGAAGVIIIHTTPSAGYPWQVVQSSWSGEQFALPAGDEPHRAVPGVDHRGCDASPDERRGPESGQAGRSREEAQLQARAAGHPHLAPRAATRSRACRPANVAGLLPGSDPKLKDEVVVFSAHHDHSGHRRAGCDGRPHLQRRARQRFGLRGDPGDRARDGARCRRSRAARCCSCSSPPRSRDCSARNTTRSIRRSLPGRSPPISISTARNIWGRTKDLTLIDHGQVLAR